MSTRPTVAGQSQDRWTPSSQFWLLAGVIFVLLIMRRPDCVTNPQFWAEDGRLYFQSQILYGFKSSLFSPYNGYISVLQRLIAGFASWFPVLRAPLIYALLGSVVDALCCSIFVLPWFRHIVQSDWMRMAACILTAVTPPADELIGTGVNTQWYVLLAGTLLLFRKQPESANSKLPVVAGWGLLGLLLPLTNPVLILGVPFCIWNILKHWRGGRWYEIGMLAGLAIQLCIFIAAEHSPVQVRGHFAMLAGAILWAFIYRAVISLAMGYNTLVAFALGHSVKAPIIAMLGCVAIIACACWKGGARTAWKLTILLYVAAASLAITLGGRNFFPLFADLSDFRGFHLERYLLLAGCSFICLLSICAEVLLQKLRTVDAIGLLVLVFAMGTYNNYRIPSLPDTNWPRSAHLIQERLDRHEIGPSFPEIRIPILPASWEIVLD